MSGEPPVFHLDRQTEMVRGRRMFEPFGYTGRRLDELIADLVAGAAPAPRATVLDYGCADSPYRHLVADQRYLGADLPGNPNATVELGADGTVPLPDASADLVLSTQVLEHVRDPARYLAECYRLLRPGGRLVLTTHGVMYLHRDPTDYWRWTCDGLRLVVEQAGFTVESTRGVLTLAAAGLQLVQQGVGGRVPRLLHKPVTALFQLLIALADRFGNEQSRAENGLVLGVCAVRPG